MDFGAFFCVSTKNRIGILSNALSHSLDPKVDLCFFSRLEFQKTVCLKLRNFSKKIQEIVYESWLEKGRVLFQRHGCYSWWFRNPATTVDNR